KAKAKQSRGKRPDEEENQKGTKREKDAAAETAAAGKDDPEHEQEDKEEDHEENDDPEGPKAKKPKKEGKLVIDLLPELMPLQSIGLVLPTEAELKQKCFGSILSYTMKRAGAPTTIAIQKGSMFYFMTSVDPYVRSILKVNGAACTQITFQKFGAEYGFRLAMILSGWIPVGELPQPLPDPSNESEFGALREMVRNARFRQC
ncbi:unnamed protein product, partial [Symbiodinium necroappetens]